MKLKNSKVFWGSIPQTPLAASAFRTASGLKLGGAWVRRKRSVPTLCPGIGCVLATPLEKSQAEMNRSGTLVVVVFLSSLLGKMLFITSDMVCTK